MDKTIIVGAGLAGLITACKIKDVPILEASERSEKHKAVLRFRDESVSHVTGIPFRAVNVNKSIFFERAHHAKCDVRMANLYAKKVTGYLSGDRSIWNLESVTRYIAPEDFYDRLCDRHEGRIQWQKSLSKIHEKARYATISTMPLPAMLKVCGLPAVQVKSDMSAANISVHRYRIPHANVFQTVYFADPHMSTFRASITGDLLIIEMMAERQRGSVFSDDKWQRENSEVIVVLRAFGLERQDVEEIERVDQRFGKIVPISREEREAILFELTHRFNVFSIGRFATWRNILLDDVVKDIEVVERLMKSSGYGRQLFLANK